MHKPDHLVKLAALKVKWAIKHTLNTFRVIVTVPVVLRINKKLQELDNAHEASYRKDPMSGNTRAIKDKIDLLKEMTQL